MKLAKAVCISALLLLVLAACEDSPARLYPEQLKQVKALCVEYGGMKRVYWNAWSFGDLYVQCEKESVIIKVPKSIKNFRK